MYYDNKTIDRSKAWWFLRNSAKGTCSSISAYLVWTLGSKRQRSRNKKVPAFSFIKVFYNYNYNVSFKFIYRLKMHISDPTNPPILIFPEGTCINNTSVMQFKKGSFEVGGVIYPVAIKVILINNAIFFFFSIISYCISLSILVQYRDSRLKNDDPHNSMFILI